MGSKWQVVSSHTFVRPDSSVVVVSQSEQILEHHPTVVDYNEYVVAIYQ